MPPSKSKAKRQSKSLSKEDTPTKLPEPKEDFTTKHCLICDSELKRPEGAGVSVQAGYRKMLDCLCLFLNLEVGEDDNWDFERENFPFCQSCTEYLQYLTVFYDQLEVVHTKVAQVVNKVKRKFARTVRGNKKTSPGGSSKKKQKDRKEERDSRTRSFRDQIQITDEDYSPHEESPLPELKPPHLGSNHSSNGDESSSKPKEAVIRMENKGSQTQETTKSKNKESQTQDLIRREDQESQTVPEIVQAPEKDLGLSVAVQTETIPDDCGDLSSDVDEFEKYVAEQLQLMESETESEELNEELQEAIADTEYSGDDVEMMNTVEDQVDESVEATKGSTDSAQVTASETSKVPLPIVTGLLIPIQLQPIIPKASAETNSRYDKLVLVPKPPWSVVPTKEGFSYGDLKAKSKGTMHICCLCEEKMSYCSQEIILDHLESEHLGKDHWYPCEYCEGTFRLVGQLHKHMRADHLGKPDKSWTFLCSVCHKRFFSPALVQRHLKIHGLTETAKPKPRTRGRPASKKIATVKSKITETVLDFGSGTSIKKSLRPRPSKTAKIVDITSEPEDAEDVVFTDSRSEDTYSSDSDFGESRRRRKSRTKKPKPPVNSDEATLPVVTTVDDIGLNKLLLCGGCGCRYYTESEAMIKTIKDHYDHHKLQRALACRICCQCYTSLPEMNGHVREHFNSGGYANYIVYCPSDVAESTDDCSSKQDPESPAPVVS